MKIEKKGLLLLLALIMINPSCSRLDKVNSNFLGKEKTQLGLEVTDNTVPENQIVDEEIIEPYFEFSKKCAQLRNDSFPVTDYQGMLVVTEQYLSDKLLLNLESGILLPFKDTGNFDGEFFISPDRGWLVYIRYEITSEPRILEFQSLENNEIYRYSLDVPDSYIPILGYWLTNTEFVVRNINIDNTNIDYVSIYTPEDGKLADITPTFPDLITDDWQWEKTTWPSVMIIDPLQEYVFYVSGQVGDYGLTLYDISKQKEVIKIDKFKYTRVPPIWKNDSSGLYFVNSLPDHEQSELFYLGIDGEIKQITNINKYLNNTFIDTITLSPDENFMVITLQNKDDGSSSILLLNLFNQTIMDLCLSPAVITPNVIWSPNSRYFAFTEYISSKIQARIIIYDTTNDVAELLLEEMETYAWYSGQN